MKLFNAYYHEPDVLYDEENIGIYMDKEMAAFLLDEVFHQLLVDLAGDAKCDTDIKAVVDFAEVLVKIQKAIRECKEEPKKEIEVIPVG